VDGERRTHPARPGHAQGTWDTPIGQRDRSGRRSNVASPVR
jgi:hypothetical protein